jgi:hypothetical protein
MKIVYAAFALLFLLHSCFIVSAETGNVRVLNQAGEDITAQNFNESGNNEVTNISEDVKAEEVKKEPVKEDEDGILKSLRATFKGALDDFTNGVINQFMEGSVNIFEAEAETNTTGENETLSYKINSKPIDPYEPSFVRKVQLPTGGFYIVGIFFSILGSCLIRLIYEKYPVQFSEFRVALTGEEKPYSNDTILTASVIAMVLWIAYILLVELIVGFRNLVISTASSTGIILPETYADSLPTFALTGIASYSSAFQSATGEYGIYTFTALMFVAGMVSEALLILGASEAFWKFNIIYWGVFTVFCFIDIIIVSAVSAGVSLYIMDGNPIYVTVGLVVSCVGIILLMIMIIVYAIKKGRKISIGW